MKNLLFFFGIAVSILACGMPVKQATTNVELEVNGEQWVSVPAFDNSTAEDKHYVVRVEDDGTAVIVFGDGKQGARPPAGTSEISARYSRGRHYVGVRTQQGRVGEKDCK